MPHPRAVPEVDVHLVRKTLAGAAGCTCGVGAEVVELLVEVVDIVHEVADGRDDFAPECLDVFGWHCGLVAVGVNALGIGWKNLARRWE